MFVNYMKINKSIFFVILGLFCMNTSCGSGGGGSNDGTRFRLVNLSDKEIAETSLWAQRIVEEKEIPTSYNGIVTYAADGNTYIYDKSKFDLTSSMPSVGISAYSKISGEGYDSNNSNFEAVVEVGFSQKPVFSLSEAVSLLRNQNYSIIAYWNPCFTFSRLNFECIGDYQLAIEEDLATVIDPKKGAIRVLYFDSSYTLNNILISIIPKTEGQDGAPILTAGIEAGGLVNGEQNYGTGYLNLEPKEYILKFEKPKSSEDPSKEVIYGEFAIHAGQIGNIYIFRKESGELGILSEI